MCPLNVFKKSCPHRARDSFLRQIDRLEEAGYPYAVHILVAEKMLKKSRVRQLNEKKPPEKEKIAVIPYVHCVSHNLKKIAKRADVNRVFSAPLKLSRLCRMTNPCLRPRPGLFDC